MTGRRCQFHHYFVNINKRHWIMLNQFTKLTCFLSLQLINQFSFWSNLSKFHFVCIQNCDLIDLTLFIIIFYIFRIVFFFKWLSIKISKLCHSNGGTPSELLRTFANRNISWLIYWFLFVFFFLYLLLKIYRYICFYWNRWHDFPSSVLGPFFVCVNIKSMFKR